jgi:hypothetical protein
VGALIRAGREMKGLMLLNKNLSRLVDLHATLASIYLDVWNNEAALRHFDSQRLKQLGHELAPIRACLKGAGHTEEEIEKHVLDKLRPLGITKTHWVLKEVFVSELVYLVDTLQILVEPDFTLPDATLVSVQGEDEATARYIPPVVKIEVWQRDGGRCVQCKSNEKLEYDHIIPVSKGGSNTARNI